ncbi:hypothetical protein [Nonomuraea sp. NPDC049646]|uniref:hypothetical protein n=1 Tax=unclassified Nonomuraea TaxID=2593643 RepID=UPI00378AB630
MGGRMHADEADIDEALVRRLLAAQFPRWAGLPLRRSPSSGTVNAVFRLGDDHKDTDPAMAADARHVIREVLGSPAH